MILFFGPAGAGKTVQAQLLAEQNGWTWLSMGKLLRDMHDAEISTVQSSGELVPVETTFAVLQDRLKTIDNPNNVILDGFPREMQQAEWLVENVERLGVKLDLAIVLNVPRDESVARLIKRGRKDDTKEAIEERLKIYLGQTIPMIYYMKEQGVVTASIDGVGTIEEVHSRILLELKKSNLIENHEFSPAK